jgi:hypothetical protein
MKKLFSVGDKIGGFCNGFFGRDDYDTKICILVTKHFAVFQYLDGERENNAVVLNATNKPSKKEVKQWKKTF